MSIPLILTDNQREGLVSGKTSSIIVMDPSFIPSKDEYRASSESNPKIDWGIKFFIRDVLVVPIRKLKKYGFSNEFVKELREKHDPDMEVAVSRIKIRR